MLCSVWALLKREQGSTRDVRKTPQTVLITSHWTDYGLRTVVYVISKLAKCLELNQSMGLLVMTVKPRGKVPTPGWSIQRCQS